MYVVIRGQELILVETRGTIELPPEEKLPPPENEPLELVEPPPEGVVGFVGVEAGPALETESPVDGADGADGAAESALETESPVDGADGAAESALETESPVEGEVDAAESALDTELPVDGGIVSNVAEIV
jgi:hypothetical protein